MYVEVCQISASEVICWFDLQSAPWCCGQSCSGVSPVALPALWKQTERWFLTSTPWSWSSGLFGLLTEKNRRDLLSDRWNIVKKQERVHLIKFWWTGWLRLIHPRTLAHISAHFFKFLFSHPIQHGVEHSQPHSEPRNPKATNKKSKKTFRTTTSEYHFWCLPPLPRLSLTRSWFPSYIIAILHHLCRK